MRALGIIENALLAQRGHLFCWTPVCLGIGVGLYFSLRFEPDLVIFAAGGVGLAVLGMTARIAPVAVAPLLVGLMLIGVGATAAKIRTDSVAAPVLGFRYYGPIEGRIVNIDRSGSDAVRLTLDQVVLARMSPARTPKKVRISLRGPAAEFFPADTVLTTGSLSPPSGPAEPGGFDFRRYAWFLQIGAVGYTRNPVVRLQAAQRSDWRLWVFTQRMALSAAVRRQISGEPGAFAAAIMTGDRSAMSQKTLGDLRATNLAHLLAISGLHMGLLTGFVFAVVRFGLALIPYVALRIATKKIAAIAALIAGAGYLALSGGNVATERAYIMVAVMLFAVLLDRRALTLRAVAMAATIVLLIQPEALVGPGFQMSFSATTALVLVFGGLRKLNTQALPKYLRPVFSVVLSSAVAGLATAPFAAATFNQFVHYGLVANVLSVPLMGLFVMPAAVLAVVLAPVGGWGVGLWIMEQGLRWILAVADRIAAIENGVSYVVAPQAVVVPMLALGLLWLALWQGRARFMGAGIAVLAGLIWTQSTRPAVLVADNGGMIGVMMDSGRALSKAKGNGFAAGIWLENDGNPVPQDEAAARLPEQQAIRRVDIGLGDWQITQVSGKTALAKLQGCGGADVLILNTQDDTDRPCQVYDPIDLRSTGSLAIDLDREGRLGIVTAADVSGARPWTPLLSRAATGRVLVADDAYE